MPVFSVCSGASIVFYASVPSGPIRAKYRRGDIGVLMKRSRSLSLILMGSLVLGGSGCGSENADQAMYTFTSINECVTNGLFSEAECLEFAKNALAQTPRFSSREECESQFGKDACADAAAKNGNVAGNTDGTTVQPHSGSSWMPMMMGFMAGRFMSGGGMMQNSQGLYRDPAQTQTQQPGARSFRTAGGETVRPDATGRVSNPSPRLTQSMSHNAKPAMNRSGSGARGGFLGGGGGGS